MGRTRFRRVVSNASAIGRPVQRRTLPAVEPPGTRAKLVAPASWLRATSRQTTAAPETTGRNNYGEVAGPFLDPQGTLS